LKSFILASASLAALATSAFAATGPKPMFVVKRHIGSNIHVPGTTPLPTWTLDWTYKSKAYSAIFVGTDPSKGGVSTTVPVYIFPVKITVGKLVEDPLKAEANGKTPVDVTVASPIFQSKTDYTQGGTDLGTTQYEDAFQRAALWGEVQSNTGYHVLLGTPTIEPEISLTVPAADSGTGSPFGQKVALVDINYFDAQVNAALKAAKLSPDSLPIFMVTQTYLTEGGCCIGGYHSYTGTQAYSVFTFIKNKSSTLVFSQDVSALSHELGEWMDDPLTNNTNIPSTCGTQGNDNDIYEVGDPLEVDANYGDYPYVLKGVTYHLQDLTLPPYFGAPTTTSVNGWFTFQGHAFTVCENGG
jgi:hypothetical protein